MAEDTGKHYRKEFKGVKLDPARIALIYGVSHPIEIAIIKKALRSGTGHKTREQDIRDIMCSCERWIEMMKEDQEIIKLGENK